MATLSLPRWSGRLFRKRRYKVPYGGRGSSKSWTIARALLMIALQPELLFPGRTAIRILCAREFQNSISESVHALLVAQIYRMGLGPWFIIKDTYIRSINGSEFLFVGIRQNVQKIKSMEDISICWVEEAEKVSNNSWQVLIPTIRAEGSEIWISFNPDQDDDPTYVRFIVNTPPEADVFPVNWRDNPWFPLELEKEKNYLFSVDPEAAEHVWEGKCNTRSNAVIFRGKYVVESFIPNAPGTGLWFGPYYGADWGFANDPCVLMKLWINYPQPLTEDQEPDMRQLGSRAISRLMIEKESWGIGVELNDIAPKWMREIPECKPHLGYAPIIRADSSRPETISHVANYGLNVIAAEKWPGSVEDGIAYLRSFSQIVIHPQCEHQIQEARLYKYKVDKITGDVLNEIVDKHNHCWDSDRYALEPAIRTVQDIVVTHHEEVSITSDLDEFEMNQLQQTW